MKVLVVNNMDPFVWGGAEALGEHLKANLMIAGHEAELLRIPFQWEPASRIPSQMMMVRAFELQNVDRVIALKFPAYLIRHPEKTLWLVHQYRQAYDLLDAGITNIPQDDNGNETRALIKAADDQSFSESRDIFTISSVTRDRLHKYNGYKATILPQPVNDPHMFTGGEVGSYIFAGGRVNEMKRQHLLLEALVKTDRKVNLVIAGPPESSEYAARLKDSVKKFGLESRVALDLRFLSREQYASYMNGAAAVACIPYDEDSLSYVAMEAATAKKAIITTSDSGGILGLVKHKETGWVAHPSTESLANAMNAVYISKVVTRSYGMGTYDVLDSMGIDWPSTVDALLK